MLVLAKTSYYLWESGTLVSASDVMPTDRWLNIWCIWHTYLETLQEFRSRHRIGWIMQDFREMCVSRSLLFCLETKMPWRQTPSRKKKAFVYNCDGECLSGSTKRCIFKSMWNIWHLQHRLFKIRLRVSHTVSYCGNIPTPRNVTLNETNCDWLFDMSVKGLMGGPWPMKAAIYSRPSAVSLKVWLGETSGSLCVSCFDRQANSLQASINWRRSLRFQKTVLWSLCHWQNPHKPLNTALRLGPATQSPSQEEKMRLEEHKHSYIQD